MRKIRARKLKLGFFAVGCAHTRYVYAAPRGRARSPLPAGIQLQTSNTTSSCLFLGIVVVWGGVKRRKIPFGVWELSYYSSFPLGLLPLNGICNSFFTHSLHRASSTTTTTTTPAPLFIAFTSPHSRHTVFHPPLHHPHHSQADQLPRPTRSQDSGRHRVSPFPLI